MNHNSNNCGGKLSLIFMFFFWVGISKNCNKLNFIVETHFFSKDLNYVLFTQYLKKNYIMCYTLKPPVKWQWSMNSIFIGFHLAKYWFLRYLIPIDECYNYVCI